MWPLLAMLIVFSTSVAFAADTTPPSKPSVTDAGSYTTSTTQLRASWKSSDSESGIAEYQYQIRQDSTSGSITVNWISTGTATSVTRTGLNLTPGKKYYFGVKAKNGAGLWSAVGYSNGIKVDTTAPSAPGQPKEGASNDLDYDGDGSYTVYWSSASDPESGISAYEIQERIGTSGTWVTLTSSRSKNDYSVSGKAPNTQYFYQVRAKNKAGLWGPWSPASDGILVDKTAASTPVVTDDGATTSSTTTLHATWTSSDAESGIVESQYEIRQDSPSGTSLVSWTSVGLATEVTRTGLSLVLGVTYYVNVKAKNGAGLWSAVGSSDGITVQANTPPTGTISINNGVPYTNTPAVTLTLSATDDSGTVAQMRFSNDGTTYSAPEAYATSKSLTLTNGDGTKTVYVKFKDAAGNWSSAVSDTILLDTTAPAAPGQPTEETPDQDYDVDGNYTVSWPAASDAESGIAAYELQEAASLAGPWTTLSNTLTGTSFAVSGKLHNTTAFFRVHAKSGAGTWSSWSSPSDGITVDTTPPTTPTVTDDGVTTASTTQLHATWTASSDPESGVVDFQYQIRQDSTTGPIIVDWTSVNLATEVTHTALSLIDGKQYFVGVRATNSAGLSSASGYADGIIVQADTIPPSGIISINRNAPSTNSPTVTLSLSATDNSGTVAQMRFSNDNVTYTTPEAYATTKTWTLPAGDGPKAVYIKFSDQNGNWSSPASDSITLDTTPPEITITWPPDGAVLGVQ